MCITLDSICVDAMTRMPIANPRSIWGMLQVIADKWQDGGWGLPTIGRAVPENWQSGEYTNCTKLHSRQQAINGTQLQSMVCTHRIHKNSQEIKSLNSPLAGTEPASVGERPAT